MLATSLEGLASLSIPLVAIIGVFAVKALRIIHDRPRKADLTAEVSGSVSVYRNFVTQAQLED